MAESNARGAGFSEENRQNDPVFRSIIRDTNMKKGEWMALAIATISILPTLVSCRKENALWKGRINSENGILSTRC
jgi:hypothetical protein